MIASPPVQPICSSTSGTGSVRTMWEEATVSWPRRGPRRPFAALPIATTARSARTAPPSVRAITPPGSERSERTAEDSKIATPSSRSRRRIPSASRAGCTVAEPGETAPPRKAGDWHRAWTSAGVSSKTASGWPSSRQAASARAQLPSWAGAVEVCR